jgi:hypothetical protein
MYTKDLLAERQNRAVRSFFAEMPFISIDTGDVFSRRTVTLTFQAPQSDIGEELGIEKPSEAFLEGFKRVLAEKQMTCEDIRYVEGKASNPFSDQPSQPSSITLVINIPENLHENGHQKVLEICAQLQSKARTP